MKRPAVILSALLLSISVSAQTTDRSAMLNADFSGSVIKESAPLGANLFEKASWEISRQLTGKDFYRPQNYMFFRPAVKEIGFFPALLALPDRILRDSRIGTAGYPFGEGQHIISEGPGA